MAIKAPIELYRRSIPEGLKTKDLFFVALQDRLTVIKPKELNRNEIKIVGYVDVEQGDFTGIQKNCIYLGKGNDRIPFDVYNKNGLKIVGYIPVEGENAYIAVVKPMSPVCLRVGGFFRVSTFLIYNIVVVLELLFLRILSCVYDIIVKRLLHFTAKLIYYKHTKNKTESRENLSRYESRHFFDGGFFICKNGGQKYESHEHCGLSQRYREEGSCYQQRHVRLADADGKPFTSSYREV